MSEIVDRGVTLDACRSGCGGVWFDADELEKFDQVEEQALPEVLRSLTNKQVVIDASAVRYCPRCTGQVMHRYYYDSQFSLEVDQCLQCNGIWLDLGELEAVRMDNAKLEQRENAIETFQKHVDSKPGGRSVKNLKAVFELLYK